MNAAYAIPSPPQPFQPAAEQFEAMVERLTSPEALVMQHQEIEDFMERDGRELLRRLFQGHVDLRELEEVKHASVEGADHVVRARVREGSQRMLRVTVGDLAVGRLRYQADGVEGLSPLDASLNLPPQLFSFGIRRIVAREVACNSYEHVVAQLAERCVGGAGKRQVEQMAVLAAADFDAFYERPRAQTQMVGSDDFLVLSADGAAIRVLPEGLRAPTRRRREQETSPERWPVPKGRKRKYTKRRAMVAAVYDVAPFERTAEDVVRDLRPVRSTDKKRRPKPKNKRVWATVEQGCEAAVEQAFADAHNRDPDHVRRWVVLVDGDEHQLECIRETARYYGVEVTIIVDVIHVLGYLWDAASCFHSRDSEAAQTWVTERLVALLTGADPSQVAAGMRRSATRRTLKDRANVDKCATYLINHRGDMNYAAALAAGMPIATGVIEGTVRYIVRDRMDRTGARWSVAGAEAVLKLRALHANRDFDDYWAFHVATAHRINHAANYADQTPPPTAPHPRLRLIK